MEKTPTNFLLHTFFLIFLTLTHFINYKTATAAAAAAASALFEIQPSLSSSSSCNGSIAECNEDLEMVVESEISRRFLDEKRRISYGTLNPNKPTCDSARGNSYNSGGCVPRSSNPYHRGCSPIYGCRTSA